MVQGLMCVWMCVRACVHWFWMPKMELWTEKSILDFNPVDLGTRVIHVQWSDVRNVFWWISSSLLRSSPLGDPAPRSKLQSTVSVEYRMIDGRRKRVIFRGYLHEEETDTIFGAFHSGVCLRTLYIPPENKRATNYNKCIQKCHYSQKSVFDITDAPGVEWWMISPLPSPLPVWSGWLSMSKNVHIGWMV